jgi:hypothetical protein
VEGCELGHHGEDVSFNSILKKYKLTDPALVLLGEIVRAADSHPSKPHPAGEGLRWVAHGNVGPSASRSRLRRPPFCTIDASFWDVLSPSNSPKPGVTSARRKSKKPHARWLDYKHQYLSYSHI